MVFVNCSSPLASERAGLPLDCRDGHGLAHCVSEALATALYGFRFSSARVGYVARLLSDYVRRRVSLMRFEGARPQIVFERVGRKWLREQEPLHFLATLRP